LCYTPSLRLDEECRLDDAVGAGAPAVDLTRPARHVLLTGATGFVGSFLLAELLATTEARVSCLVRGRNPAEATARLRRSLERYDLPLDGLDGRVDVVVGELSAPWFGLAPAALDQLAGSVDAILHNGAKVDHVRGYLQMKPANVTGTGEILRFASHRRLKPVHLISTLGTVYPPSHRAAGVVGEDAPPGPLGQLPNGYMQSKCIAEELVLAARARGVPAAIYRLGAITGHSVTGMCNPGDFTYSALRTTINLGFADDLDADLTLTPVDYAVRAIVGLMRWPDAPGQVFHVTHPRPWTWLELVASLRRRGHAIETMTYGACMRGLFEIARRGVDTPMLSFLSFITQRVPGSSRYVAEDYHAPVRWDCERTLAGLTRMGVEGPPPPERLLDTYLDHLTRSGLIAQRQPIVNGSNHE
jgi:thioester reductase-like protein